MRITVPEAQKTDFFPVMMVLTETAKARHKLVAALVVISVVALISKEHPNLTSTAHIRAYTKAGVKCSKLNETEIESWIVLQRDRLTGFCLRPFPSEYDCVDKLSFLYGCEHLNKMQETVDAMGRLLAFFVVGALLVSCVP